MFTYFTCVRVCTHMCTKHLWKNKQKITSVVLDDGYPEARGSERREKCNVSLWNVWRLEPLPCECVSFLHGHTEGIAISPPPLPRFCFSRSGVGI